jgi:hypothetical protein
MRLLLLQVVPSGWCGPSEAVHVQWPHSGDMDI